MKFIGSKQIKLPATYGLLSTTERRLVRERYIDIQKELCWYCNSPLKDKSPHFGKKKINWHRFPPGFLDHPVHLHHDHDTGLTIGAVHAFCNAVSFDFDESPLGSDYET